MWFCHSVGSLAGIPALWVRREHRLLRDAERCCRTRGSPCWLCRGAGAPEQRGQDAPFQTKVCRNKFLLPQQTKLLGESAPSAGEARGGDPELGHPLGAVSSGAGGGFGADLMAMGAGARPLLSVGK